MKIKFGLVALAIAMVGTSLFGCGGGGSDYGSAPREGTVIIIPDTGAPVSAPTDTSVTDLSIFVSPEFDAVSNEMNLYFYVTDQDGNRFNLFNKHNLQVTINGVAHVSNGVPETELGIITGVQSHTVALGLDESGSMSAVDPITGLTSMELTKNAAKLFVDRMESTDKTAVVAFSTEARILQAVTKDKAALKAAISTLEPTNATNIGDCIIKTVNVLGAYPGKTAAVVMTDGGDTEGIVEEGIKVAKDAGMPVFTIGLGAGVDEENLQHIADETGGRFFLAATTDLNRIFTVDLPNAIDELNSRTASVYRFTYPLGRLQWPATEQVQIDTIFTFENARGVHRATSTTRCQVVGR